MKTVLITGANKSIGFETARQLLKKGYFVYLGSRDRAKGDAAASKLKEEGLTEVGVVEIDISDSSSIARASQEIASLDVLINNGGISGGFPQEASKISSALLREVFDTNFFGTIEVTQAFLGLLRKSPTPVIVNVTSGLGSLTLHSDPKWKYYEVKGGAYGPSKSALNAYTVALAYELRETAFRVNVVDPGYTATDFNNFRGPGSVESAGTFVARYAMIGTDGPTGRFFSNDYEGKDNESPW